MFFTPELLVGNRRWLKVLSSDAYHSRLRGFIIDEAHTVKKINGTVKLHVLY